jgi:hypothetical protein
MKNKFFPVEIDLSSGGIPSTRNQNFSITTSEKLQYFHARKTHQIDSDRCPLQLARIIEESTNMCLQMCSSGNGGIKS